MPVNLPKKSPEDDTSEELNVVKDYYVFADYLSAGHHTFIVFNQFDNCFYTFDMVVDFNTKDLFTDFPDRGREPVKLKDRSFEDFWRHWEGNTPEAIQKMLENDKGRDSFDFSEFLGPKIAQQMKQDDFKVVLEQNYAKILTAFNHLAGQSPNYPRVSVSEVKDFLDASNLIKVTDIQHQEISLTKTESFLGNEPFSKSK